MQKLPKGWTRYGSCILNVHADCMYQKLVKGDKEDYTDIHVNVLEYNINGKKSWEVDCQIKWALNILGRYINLRLLSYKKLDFIKMEEDALQIINRLSNLNICNHGIPKKRPCFLCKEVHASQVIVGDKEVKETKQIKKHRDMLRKKYN